MSDCRGMKQWTETPRSATRLSPHLLLLLKKERRKEWDEFLESVIFP